MALIELGISHDEAITEELKDSEPLPKGLYEIKIGQVLLNNGELFTSENTGTHNFKLEIIVSAPGLPQDGKKMKHTITVDGNARPMFTRFCKALNISWTDTTLELDKLVGLSAQAMIIIENYNGRDINKIQYFA